MFHVRSVTQGDVIRADAKEIPRIFQVHFFLTGPVLWNRCKNFYETYHGEKRRKNKKRDKEGKWEAKKTLI